MYVHVTKELLVNNPAIVHEKYDYRKETLLMQACKWDPLNKIQLLLEYGADVNMTDICKETPLIYACRNGRPLEIIELLFAHGANVHALGLNNETVLMIACDSKNTPEVIEFLIKQGADVNAKSRNNLTALMLSHHPKVALKLIEYGAIVHMKTWTTALIYACQENKASSLIKLLLNHKDANHISDDKNIVSCINNTCEAGRTALMNICQYGKSKDSFKTLQLLLDAGSDLNMRTNSGSNALMLTCLNNKNGHKMAASLLNNGADIYAKDNHGNNLLGYACLNNCISTQMIDFLIDAGIDMNEKNNSGNTPLSNYCYTGCSYNVLEMLCKHGAHVNVSNNMGRTPLMSICDTKKDASSLVQLLIDYGADVYKKSVNHKIALEMIRNKKNMAVMLKYMQLDMTLPGDRTLISYVMAFGYGEEYVNELTFRHQLRMKQYKIYDKVLKYIPEHDAAVRYKIGNMGYKICKYYEDKIITQELLDYLGATTESVDRLVDVYLGY